MSRTNGTSALVCLGLALLALGAYANHFQNEFHFDDVHTVTGNPYIRDLGNVPRFFADARTFSIQPDHASYRPVTSLTLALDYALGDGYKPVFFHASTFAWYVVLVCVLFLLFRRILDLADPHPSNLWIAAAAAACYALHPANAETVNYVIQRADLLATAGTAVSLLWFMAWPAGRRWALYLVPLAAGFLAKPPNSAWPFLLLYVFLFEQEGALEFGHWRETRKKWMAAFRAIVPALLVTVALALVAKKLTPPTFAPVAPSRLHYWLTQPWVALHYFKSFFLPTELSADTDWTSVSSWHSGAALCGYGFVLGLVAVALHSSRRRETRPIAFGILWFFIAMAPTSLIPLGEVTNDHRMFFPFVGLALAVFWALRLCLFRITRGLATRRTWIRAAVAALAVVLAAEAVGTHTRNEVWRTEESLWKDVSLKSPRNWRGLLNYGIALGSRGEHAAAMEYFERAKALAPDMSPIEVNMGSACAAMHLNSAAQQHFELGIRLSPALAEPYFHYGSWLQSVGRDDEAIAQLQTAIRMNALSFGARHLLMQLYSRRKDWAALDRLLDDTLKFDRNDDLAKRFEEERENRPRGQHVSQ